MGREACHAQQFQRKICKINIREEKFDQTYRHPISSMFKSNSLNRLRSELKPIMQQLWNSKQTQKAEKIWKRKKKKELIKEKIDVPVINFLETYLYKRVRLWNISIQLPSSSLVDESPLQHQHLTLSMSCHHVTWIRPTTYRHSFRPGSDILQYPPIDRTLCCTPGNEFNYLADNQIRAWNSMPLQWALNCKKIWGSTISSRHSTPDTY